MTLDKKDIAEEVARNHKDDHEFFIEIMIKDGRYLGRIQDLLNEQ